MKIGFAGAGYIINIHAQAAKNNGLELVVAEKFAEKVDLSWVSARRPTRACAENSELQSDIGGQYGISKVWS